MQPICKTCGQKGPHKCFGLISAIPEKPKYEEDKPKLIIQLSGKKRAGKDTIAKYLTTALETAYDYKVEVMSFAEPMKDIIATILGLSLEDLDLFKNRNDIYRLRVIDTDGNIPLHTTDCRQILQQFGSEAMKKWFGNDVWANLLNQRIKDSTADVIIIPDWRFEIEEITSSLKIRISSNNCDLKDTHVSETELDSYEHFDLLLNNDDYKLTQQQIEWLVATDTRFKGLKCK